MGVLNCSRNGRDDIMCTYASDDFGYLCFDCFEEMQKAQLLDKKFTIDGFLETPKSAGYDHRTVDLSDIFYLRQGYGS
jgi:hypothetical protein